MAGSIVKVTLDGQTFNVAADSNFSQNPGVETEGIRHSGGTTFKSTKLVKTVEGVDLMLNGQEFLDIEDLEARKEPFSMSYEEATGDVWRATGKINRSARETDTTKCPITMIPGGVGWEPFLA